MNIQSTCITCVSFLSGYLKLSVNDVDGMQFLLYTLLLSVSGLLCVFSSLIVLPVQHNRVMIFNATLPSDRRVVEVVLLNDQKLQVVVEVGFILLHQNTMQSETS